MAALKKSNIKIELPPKLVDLFSGDARYRAAYGGRGSGKTRSFALMAALRAYELSQGKRPVLIVCAREYGNSLHNSLLAELRFAINSYDWLKENFDVGEKYIRSKNGLVNFAFIGLNRNLSSIKSMANIAIFWVDEAENVSEEAWQLLLPTVREEGSEIWISWNPCSKNSAVHKRFRQNEAYSKEMRLKIVKLNWQDNPWFPKELNAERLNDKKFRPQYYEHIWEGEFCQAFAGAYFTSSLIEARSQGRFCAVAPDPLMSYRSFWDIGGAGARADATAIWIAQFIGQEIRVLDYYEAQGQPLAVHIDWMRVNGYGNALVFLPHDGRSCDRVHDISFETALQQAGFNVEIVPNQGAGAARLRIEAVRRIFPRIWFDEAKTRAGVEALAWYHEKRDELRGIGLGPEHDWSSHAADAFGLLCLLAAPEYIKSSSADRYRRSSHYGGWMSL